MKMKVKVTCHDLYLSASTPLTCLIIFVIFFREKLLKTVLRKLETLIWPLTLGARSLKTQRNVRI